MTKAVFAPGGLLVVALLAGPAATPERASAQSRPPATTRLSTTVGALASYPVFFHAHAVRVRGVITMDRGALALTGEEVSVLLVGAVAAGLSPRDEPLEIDGTFIDAGRLSAGDPRLSGVDVEGLSQGRLGKAWPGVNQLPLLIASSSEKAAPFPVPSVRALALAPNRYGDSRVTVSGRFRARNVYGDQPDAPGRSPWDFVLQAADASIWVVGLRPRGVGFNFRLDSKVDTSEWLEVSGVVRQVRRLVVIEADRISLAKPVLEPAVPAVTQGPIVGPPPEVLFSAPIGGETDVAPSSRVRIQFSRDLDAGSLKGRVQAFAAPTGRQGAAPADGNAPLKLTTAYDEGARVLEIRFAEPPPAYSVVRIELTDGIKATDGAALAAWTLSFSLGG